MNRPPNGLPERRQPGLWWEKLVVSLSFADLADPATRDRLDAVAAKMNSQGIHMAAAWRYARALPMLTAAVEVWERLEQVAPLVGALNVRGAVYRQLGEFEAAVADHDLARDWAREHDLLNALVMAQVHLGADYVAAGMLEQAEAALAESLALSEHMRDVWGSGHAQHVWGLLAEAAKDWDGALAHYGAAVAYWRDREAPAAAMESTAGVVRVLLAQGQLAAAWALAEDVLRHLGEHGPVLLDDPLRVYWTLYRVLHMAQQHDSAHEMLRVAHMMMEQQADGLDSVARHRFLTCVPVNRAIGEAWAERHEA